MSAKTLYVSDLDETLIRNDERISTFTVETVNALIKRGMLFSFATARSARTAAQVTEGLSPKMPVIVYNGAFILENGTGKKLLSNRFSTAEIREILDTLLENEQYPLVYSYQSGVEKFSYFTGKIMDGIQKHLDRRAGDPRRNPVDDLERLYDGDVFCVTCMDCEAHLQPLYEKMKDRFQCIYFKDVYSGIQWLEFHPMEATKANAVLRLKELLGADRVVCFGNGKNDISMFRVADECYAVANAEDELKQIATGVIASNEDDGVAKWLSENVEI